MNNKIKSISKLGMVLAIGALLATATLTTLTLSTPPTVKAWSAPCDFLTGGGFIIYNNNHGNFGIGGGCKNGSGYDGVPYWGHLEYIDHGNGLNAHATEITAYMQQGGATPDPKTGQPTGDRLICGKARTNLFGDVNFAVYVRDAGEPGSNDTFDIRMRNPLTNLVVYDTTNQCWPHFLGSSAPCAPGNGGGGNIQLHKPNPSNTVDFGGQCPGF